MAALLSRWVPSTQHIMQAPPLQPPRPSCTPQPEQASTPPCHEHPQAAAGAAGANLQALCSETVFESLSQQQLDVLDDMPPHVLAQLLRDCAAQRKELQRRLADAEQQAQEWKKRRYIVDPPQSDERVDDAMYDRADAVISKWQAKPEGPGRFGGCAIPTLASCAAGVDRPSSTIVYDFKLQIFKLVNDEENISFDIRLSFVLNTVISSALLLYRLRCLFPVEVQHGERYKCVWKVEVVHKASGVTLEFFDCQGAAKAYPSTDDLSQQFLEDEVELLNLLCDPRCPHTYDGTVAGCVA